jgi:subtilisin family serine protease
MATRSRFLAAAAGTAVLFAAACQPPPPPLDQPAPAPVPTAPPTTHSPPTPVSCDVAPLQEVNEPWEATALEGDALGAAAFAAAREAAATNGLVEITTVADGRPDFEVVTVEEVGEALASEVDPVVSLDAAQPVEASQDIGAATNDPLHPQQWSDNLTPYSPVWSCGRGGGVTVAVVDTGVDGAHPDLAGRVTPGGSSLDGAASVTPGTGSLDPNGHGTHVAGIAAATADNGLGIAGVAPGATVLPVRVLSASGSGWSTDVAAGIVFAADQGADVINLSLGSGSQSTSMANAIDYAHASGVVVLAAAGNSGPTGPTHYPAAGANTVAVASVTSSGAISGFSTWGSFVDLAAPGSSILSTLPGGGYGYKSGTSMATPFAAGVAALMLDANPAMTPDQVAARLVGTANDAGPAGHDVQYGHGIIDPQSAVTGR